MRQKSCRSYFRAPPVDYAKRILFSIANFVVQPLYLFMLVVFTSFLLFFGLLLWYADKHNRGNESDRPDNYRRHVKREIRSNTVSDFDYFDPNCSQFPLNFPKTSPRGLGYSTNKTAK
jgi:hypothetical protein